MRSGFMVFKMSQWPNLDSGTRLSMCFSPWKLLHGCHMALTQFPLGLSSVSFAQETQGCRLMVWNHFCGASRPKKRDYFDSHLAELIPKWFLDHWFLSIYMTLTPPRVAWQSRDWGCPLSGHMLSQYRITRSYFLRASFLRFLERLLRVRNILDCYYF